ncbi:MAG: tetratricopeptide repeat protein [Proteobacteria bacterium]|nr:tetratricopeptide repeat protein [Pseudomonadota bacterium]
MSEQNVCSKCGSTSLKWVTVRRHVPVDVLQCQRCGTAAVEEDWVAPIAPFLPENCINCGDRREFDVCVNCGLSAEDDRQVHDELRALVAPTHDLLNAARAANKMGRRLIALKLATAAVSLGTGEDVDVARALRVWLLSAIGEGEAASEDARYWVERSDDPPAVAFASYGQMLQHNNELGRAADIYKQAIERDPRLTTIRARRANLLVTMSREGQASEEAIKVFEAEPDEQAAKLALSVAETLCDKWEASLRDDEIRRMVEKAGDYIQLSAKMLAHRARVAALDGDTSAAKRDLKAARRIAPDLDIYARIESEIRPAKQSWWRF